MAYDFDIRKKRDLLEAVHEYGIVPYFRTSIPGFSLQEHGHASVLFSDSGDDTWEWKGPVIRETGCAYGKFFEKKAACVGRELFPDLANCRRDGYDFDARHDDGLAKCQDRRLRLQRQAAEDGRKEGLRHFRCPSAGAVLRADRRFCLHDRQEREPPRLGCGGV